MAIVTITASLNGGDQITPNADLTYKVYNGSDSLITSKGSANTDTDVSVIGDVVTLINVDIGSETLIKITSTNQFGQESPLSDVFDFNSIPVITLNGSANISIDQNSTYVEQGATAFDNLDGDITNEIVIGGDVVDTSTLGTYLVTYNVTNSQGNQAVEVIRTVEVIQSSQQLKVLSLPSQGKILSLESQNKVLNI